MAGNMVWWPGPLEWLGVILYRLAYVAIVPVHFVVGRFSPAVDFHWPIGNWVVSAYLTPALAWAGWRGYRRLRPPPGWLARLRNERRARAGGAAALSRRELIASAATGAIVVAGASTALYATLIAPRRVVVREYRIAIRGLAPALSGLRLVHISDTHYGPFVSLGFLAAVMERANRLEPDLVVLTGDYVHRTARAIAPGIGVFARLRARLGIVAVLGNHDHWEGASACRRALQRAGIPTIDNSRRFIVGDELVTELPATPGLCVAGLGDLWEDAAGFSSALAGVPAAMPRILLSHNPDAAERVPADLRVDLMLSGHTHGGQLRFPAVGAPLVPSAYGDRYEGGLCKGPRCDVLVSRGVGLSIIPVRFGVAPEIGLITLERE